ncbi:MAG: hypothetical protein IKB93_00335 [Clostridia bacterium]|nr:hypothetical protein [Clostridia bacterium]
MVEIYKKNGYDSIVLTNHFTVQLPGESTEEKIKWYLQDYYKCCEEGALVGLNVILGAELRFTENNNDYLIFGISPEDFKDIYKLLPYGIDTFYREYINEKNVIIQAHPFRDGMQSVNPESLDGVEVFNLHLNHNSRIGLAAKYAHENQLIATCGSDIHHYGQECLCGILTSKPLENSYDVSDVLKSRDYRMTIGGYLVSI